MTTALRRCWHRVFGRIARVRIGFARIVQNDVDLGEAEPGEIDIEVEVDQFLKLLRQQVRIPARIERELVIREHVGPLLCRGEMRQRERRHLLHTEKLGSLYPAVPA